MANWTLNMTLVQNILHPAVDVCFYLTTARNVRITIKVERDDTIVYNIRLSIDTEETEFIRIFGCS